MGNQMTDIFSNRKTGHVSNLWRSVESKLHTASKRKAEDFIIKYKHANRDNDNNIDINSLDQRRIVFVSLIGFYQTWEKCPTLTLYTCLLLMPLKRKWIYNPKKYIDELKHCFISQLSFFSDAVKMNSFIELLIWKDSQGLILWLLDDEKICPFWYSVSKKLTNLWDPISGTNYKPLNLDKDYWQNKNDFNAKYNVKKTSTDILKGSYLMKFKPMQEIIYESNPNSLNPIAFYGETDHIPSHKKTSDVYDEFDDGEEVENWWISEDYDPNDIDPNDIDTST